MSEKGWNFADQQAVVRLPSSTELVATHPPVGYKRTKAFIIGLCLGVLGMGGFVLRALAFGKSPVLVADGLCPQAKPITPVKHSAIWDTLVKRPASDEQKKRTIEWLSGAVRIRYASHRSLAPEIISTICDTVPNRTITWIP